MSSSHDFQLLTVLSQRPGEQLVLFGDVTYVKSLNITSARALRVLKTLEKKLCGVDFFVTYLSPFRPLFINQ